MGEGGDGGRVLRPRGRGRAGSPWACREGVLRPPHRQLPLLSSCQFSILSCAGKGGRCAQPRMKAKPPPGLSAGGRTGLWLKKPAPKVPARPRSAPGRWDRAASPLPEPTSPLCSAPGAGRGGFPLPDTTGGGLRGPQNAGSPRRAEGLGEKGAAEVRARGSSVPLPPRAPRTKINSASTGLWPCSSSAATKSHLWCQTPTAKPTRGAGEVAQPSFCSWELAAVAQDRGAGSWNLPARIKKQKTKKKQKNTT